MQIVMIGPFAFKPKGTVSVRAFFVARALVRRGHQVTILMPPYDNPAHSGRIWEQEGVRLENMSISRNDAVHQIVVPWRMAQRAGQLNADVVHVFKPIGYSGLTGMYLRWFSRRPVLLDTDDWEGRGGWSDVNHYPALWKRFFDWQERWLARHVDGVTVASRTLETQIWGLGVEPVRVVYLPNGPDARMRDQGAVTQEQIAKVRARLGVGDAPLALYLGHIPQGTDLDLALEALAQVRELLPDARLVIAGVGDGLSGLKTYAQQLGIADQVIFPGWIEHHQSHVYLAAANAAINPYRDTLINRAKCAGKVVAAMAMGKAVITSRVGENMAYIEHGRSGLLTEPGDSKDLAQALLTVLMDRSMANALGHNAQERIWARFDWDARMSVVERAYQMAMRQR
jgi:glycosyltransferase involved in cell wall biosynthesis